jgi:alpha-amylase/alpha-mannosidase (GH57 family)
MTKKPHLICIHAHFYQPPRENPWLEAIEVQDSALPFHDWNERIEKECYGPNARAKLMGDRGIKALRNNYEDISFNVGPTLLSWMEERAPDTLRRIVEADARSRAARRGHGNALAQPYNHMIMPLASDRDKITQVLWGIEVFSRYFHRDPEGMWLPECAVDLKTLRILAEYGIRYTILAPHQCRRIRPIGGSAWRDTEGGSVDPSTPYLMRLGAGKSLVVFFYDGPISRAVAFEGLLASGETLFRRLLNAFSPKREWPQLVHIATDGESYGHHHHFGEMALSYCIDLLKTRRDLKLTNYGEFLELHPPHMEAQIWEGSSWSCVHGLGRWRSDCGCSSGRQGWHQKWRSPLRRALDFLRDEADAFYEERASGLFRYPWVARNRYIAVILDRSWRSRQEFLEINARDRLSEEERGKALKLLELQRNRLLMYTSCGWFFDEISGIETVQVLRYAARTVQLGKELGKSWEKQLLSMLEEASSNLPEYATGRGVYEQLVSTSSVDLRRVLASSAVKASFDELRTASPVYCFDMDLLEAEKRHRGSVDLTVGRIRAVSRITAESEDATFGVLLVGGADVVCALTGFLGHESYEALREDLFARLEGGDFSGLVRAMDRHFSGDTFTLRDLLMEDRRSAVERIVQTPLARLTPVFRTLYDDYQSSVALMREYDPSLHSAVRQLTEYLLARELRDAAAVYGNVLELPRVREILQRASSWGLELRCEILEHSVNRDLFRRLDMVLQSPRTEAAESMERALELARAMKVRFNEEELRALLYEKYGGKFPPPLHSLARALGFQV